MKTSIQQCWQVSPNLLKMYGAVDIPKGQTVQKEVFNNRAKIPRKAQILAMIWKNFDVKITKFGIKGEEKIT